MEEKTHRKMEYCNTKYPGVLCLLSGIRTVDGKPEKIYYIRYRDPEGRSRFEKAGRQSMKMTPAKAAGIRDARSKGKELPNPERRAAKKAAKRAEAEKWTIDRLWEAWLADPDNKDKSGNLKADLRYKKHLKKLFGVKEAKDLTELDVDRLRISLAKKYAEQTTKSILSLLSRTINFGADKKYCQKLPFDIVPGKRRKGKIALGREARPKRSPTAEETQAFLKACAEWPDRQTADFMLFMVYTGCRRGSAWNLTWEDVSLDAATAVLRTKTGNIRIPLSEECVEMLRNHPRGTESPYVFSGRGYAPVLDDVGKPVLHKKNGRMRPRRKIGAMLRLTQGQINRVPRQIADAAGLSKELDPCHSWRRNLATKLDASGASTKTIMSLGGWRTPSMVLHYTAIESSTVAEAANTLGKIITGSQSNGDTGKTETA